MSKTPTYDTLESWDASAVMGLLKRSLREEVFDNTELRDSFIEATASSSELLQYAIKESQRLNKEYKLGSRSGRTIG